MSSSRRLEVEAPPLASLPRAAPAHRRIKIPLHHVLRFARQDSQARPSRQLAFALRPLLALALTTAGLCPGLPVAPLRRASSTGGAAALPADRRRGQASGALASRAADPEVLFSALSSLVEVVKTLTPSAGRVYAHLGHEAVTDAEGLDEDDRRWPAHTAAAAAPRSEVVIELVSTAGSAYACLPPAIREELGSLAFELAVVAAIVESKGGEMQLGTPGGDSRSFVVRLPVSRC